MNSLSVLSENYADSRCTVTVSSGSGTKARIIDSSRTLRWGSLGSSEGAAETVLIEFKDREGNAISRTINRLIIQNSNLAQFYVEYWDGAAWQTIAESVYAGSPNTAVDLVIAIAVSVSTLKIRLTATNTIGAAAQKLIGDIKACLLVATVRHLVQVKREDWDEGGSYRLQGGGLVTYQSAQRFNAAIAMFQVSLATYELIMPALKAKTMMTWLLWADFRPADIYEVAATGKINEVLDKKMQTFDLEFDVGER